MARLIEIQDLAKCPGSLTVQQGDVLSLSATGARLRSGDGVVELLGSFSPGILADNGEIITPLGPPATVLILARRSGRASIDVIVGDPFHSPREVGLHMVVKT